MGPQETIALVEQLTTDLGETYSAQASLVSAELTKARGVVGQYQEYVCSSWICGHFRTEDPSGFDKVWHWPNLHGEPHSRQGEANTELQNAETKYNSANSEQTSQQEKLAKIPGDVGNFLVDWFGVDTDFAKIYYPQDRYDVGAPGESWLGENSATYDSALGRQEGAASKVRDVVGDLVTNTSTFLGDVTDSISNLTDLALSQERIYTQMLTGLIQDYSKIGGFISAAKELVTTFESVRQQHFDRIKEQGRQLAGAVDSVINVALLQNDLATIGPGGKWPEATGVASDKDNAAEPSDDEVRNDAAWFQAHVNYWHNIAQQMGALSTKSSGTSRLPVIMIDLPQFSAAASTSLNGLADDLHSAIEAGKNSAGQMETALKLSIQNYINNEVENTTKARQIYNEYFPD